jgi:hypothetical protein
MRAGTVAAVAVVALLGACGGDDELAADAGEDFSVAVGESPTFDGCGSSGEIVNYRWKILEAPPTMADDAGKVIEEVDPDCSFTLDAAMIAEEEGSWVIELTVTDAGGATSTDTVAVEVTA